MSQTLTQSGGGATGAGGGPGTAQAPNDVVTLVAGDVRISGWQAVRITTGLERMPGDFDIALTESFPGQAQDVLIAPGTPCKVLIGSDPVITGYIDRYLPSFDPKSHQVRVQGRSKCQDLVDCSAGIDQNWEATHQTRGMQINTGSLLKLATELAAPFNIKVTSLTGNDVPVGAPNAAVVQFNITLTETPFEIIERVARYAGVLVYEGTDGNLILANVSADLMTGGFAQGVNVEAASVAYTMDQRYSVYVPSLSSVDANQDMGGSAGIMPFPPVFDIGVPRFRPLIVVSEQSQYGELTVRKRAVWEMNRRVGRSQTVRLTCDKWRDVAGKLWSRNANASLNLPKLKLSDNTWIITEVTFSRDAQRGTVADIEMMPPEAFWIEPSNLESYDWQVSQALQHGAADYGQSGAL